MKQNEIALKILNMGKEGYKDDTEGFGKLNKANKLIDEYVSEQLRLNRFSGRFSSNDIDLSYCCGVFNVVGIDGLSDELKRLKEINKKPHEIFSFISNDR